MCSGGEVMGISEMIAVSICIRKHGNPVEISRTSKLIDTGMRKEITILYRCPLCGREWEKKKYV